MRQILIICPFFPPSAASGSYRMLGFARHLPTFDWEVSVVASGPIPWEANDLALQKLVPAETNVKYIDYPLARARRFWPYVAQRLNWINGYHLWNAPALKACQELIDLKRFDAILTSGPPHTVHLIGRALKRRYELPWIADFRDPWCSWGKQKRYTGKPAAFSKAWERSIFAEADIIVANTPNTSTMFSESYPHSAKRIVTVPNGYDPVEVERSQERNSQKLTLLHTGVVYAGRDPRPLAQAVREIGKTQALNGRKPVLRLIGTCLNRDVAEELVSVDFSPWVQVEDHVPYHESQAAVWNADILVLLDSNDRLLGVPAKLYEYVGANRPILALAAQEGDTAQVLRQSGATHQIVSDWSSQALQSAVLKLAAQPSDSSHRNNGANMDFTRKEAAKKLAQVLNRLVKVCSATV